MSMAMLILTFHQAHYPPPGNCSHVPPGAWVINHPRDLPGRVHIHVYEPHYSGRGCIVGEFNIGSGEFIRIILRD